MGGAPVVQTVRPGVQLVSAAADSFRRLEARIGRPIDVNSTYRDWDTQLRMYNNWTAYINGRGPYPGHSRALHPDYSKHCQGLALDSDDWTTPGFINLAAEYGWIRTAANDPTEQHHFEYQWWSDTHRNDPVPAGEQEKEPEVPEPEEDNMLNSIFAVQSDGLKPDKGRVFAIFRDPRTGELVKNHITDNGVMDAIRAAYRAADIPRGGGELAVPMTARALNKIPTWKK